LEKIELFSNSYIKFNWNFDTFEKFRSIRSWYDCSDKITENGLIAVAKNCLNLKILNIKFLKLTKNGLLAINCLKLEIIEQDCNENITD
jgi:hypothetical protein